MITDPSQPIHLLLPVWGEKYVRTALDVCVSSLLAPGNLPTLPNPAELVVVTTEAGWGLLTADPLYAALLAAGVEVVWLPMAEPPAGAAKMRVMSDGHLAAARRAYEARALTMFLASDTFHVDGSLPRLVDRAQRAGIRAVMAVAWGASGETFRALGGYQPGRPWPLSTQRAAELAVRHMHSGYRCWDFEGPCFGDPRFPVSPWWRVSDDAVVTHSLAWAAAMLNYARVPQHDTRCLEEWTVDGDHPYRNAPDPRHWHVVSDSDEHLMVGLSNEADLSFTQEPGPRLSRAKNKDDFKAAALRAARYSAIMDPLKRKLFEVPVLLHGSEVDASAVSARARELVLATNRPMTERDLIFEYPPQLLMSYAGVNLVAYAKKVYVVPQHLGPLDLDDPDDRMKPGIVAYATRDEARRAVGLE